jgi:hypothetical protein
MATKITGKARVHGLRGNIAYTGVATPSNQLLQSAGFTKDAGYKDRLLNPDTGEPIGGAYAQENIAGDIEFIPVADAGGNTLANARAALALPALPFLVTLSGFDHASLNGSYMCEGPIRTQFTPNDNCRVTLPLVKFLATGSDAATLTTVVS